MSGPTRMRGGNVSLVRYIERERGSHLPLKFRLWRCPHSSRHAQILQIWSPADSLSSFFLSFSSLCWNRRWSYTSPRGIDILWTRTTRPLGGNPRAGARGPGLVDPPHGMWKKKRREIEERGFDSVWVQI